MSILSTGFGHGKRDWRCQILGMLCSHAERFENCVWRSDTRRTVPSSASEAKAQMFPSIILNVSLFARWLLECVKVSHRLISSVPSSNRIDLDKLPTFGTPVVPAYASVNRLQTSASISAQILVRYKISSEQDKRGFHTGNHKFGIYKFIFMWPPTSYKKLIKEFLCCLARTKLPV